MGITTYVSYISTEYAIMRFELFKQVAKVTSIQKDINSIVDQTINTYTLKHTGYTGIKGYLLVRTRRFGTWNRMLNVIDGPNLLGVVGELSNIFFIIFMPGIIIMTENRKNRIDDDNMTIG